MKAKRAARLEAERFENERLEITRLEAEKAEAERLECARLEAAKLKAEVLETARLEAERFDSERLESARLEAEKLEAERLESERLEAAQLEAEVLETARLEAERFESEKLEFSRLETEKLEAERLETERLEAAKLEAEVLESARLEAERFESEKLESARLVAAKLEAEVSEATRLKAERFEAESLETAKLEAEKLEAERLEIVRLEAAKLKAEVLETARLEAERFESEKLESARLETEKLEAERLETEAFLAETEAFLTERSEAERLKTARLEIESPEVESPKTGSQESGSPESENLKEDNMDPSFILTSKSWKLSELTEILKSKTEKLNKNTVIEIIRKAHAILKEEKIIQTFEHKSKVSIVGDTHGQFSDLIKLLEMNGWPNENNPYIFNGDFVDRGAYGCEVLLLILVLKICWPQHVLLNRGNHEVMWVSTCYGFSEECREKYDNEVYKLFVKLFNILPLAAVIHNIVSGKRVFVVHGGLYGDHEKYGIEWINENIKKPDDTKAELLLESNEVVKNVEKNEILALKHQIVQDLLWSDPRQKMGMHDNTHRGQGKVWGPDETTKFCRAQKIEYIVRSHETVEGWETTHGQQVHTVFSAANYCGTAGNLGAVLVIEGEKMTARGLKFEAANLR